MLKSAQTENLRGFAYGFDPYLPSPPEEMSIPRGLAMCLAGSAGVLLSVWACRQARLETDAERRTALIEAFGPLRPVDGRLAGVSYAPRGGGRSAPRDDRAWRQAVSEVEERAADQPAIPAALANQALVDLAMDDTLADAVALLEQASRLPGAGASIWSDLSAAELALAGNDPRRLVLALAAADRAVALDPHLPEALFNRSTIAGSLSLRTLAKEDWQSFLTLDAASPWAAEARKGLVAENEPTAAERWEAARPGFEKAVAAGDERALSTLAARFPGHAGDYLESAVLPGWAKAVEAGDAGGAARWARAARGLACRLLKETGDRFDTDAVSAIENVPPALARDLARAHRLYAEGMALYRKGDYTAALPRFAGALAGFDRARSPFSLAARTQLAACRYQTGDWKRALDASNEALGAAKEHVYWSLVGHNGWMIGLIRLEAGEADPAGEPLDEALDAFRRVQDTGSEASVQSLRANRLAYLRNGDAAWRVRRDALTTASRAGDVWSMTAVFGAAARALSRDELTPEAIHFQNEVLSAAKISGDPQRVAEADWGLAAIYRGAKDSADARRLIEQAEREASNLPDPKAARPTRAGIAAEAGWIWLATNPQRAERLFAEALHLYEDNAYSRIDILLGRARARRALGNARGAEGDLVAALGECERQRDRVRRGPERASFFETARNVIEELIALELDAGRPERAFDVAEGAKARLLLDSLAAKRLAPARPLATAAVEREMPDRTALVEYAVLPDRVVLWARGEGSVASSIAWQKADVERMVADLTRAVANPSGDPAADRARFESLSGELYERLVAPVLDRIPRGDTLVVVPDGVLRDVPFAALRDPESKGYLCERNPLVVAPSATIFLAPGRPSPPPLPRARWHSLAVGNAAIDFRRYPEHGKLPLTAVEASEVEQQHPGALLLEDKATIPAFLADLDRFDLIHFAGHAWVAPPARAALLLTPSAAPYEKGALDAETIAVQGLTRPRLAVLAACSAAGGSRPDLEGGADLARSFFEAGVPAVVGNLWTLRDEEATTFLRAFYQSFWQGRSATVALQDAQLAMIHHPDLRFHRPAVWGGFRLLSTAAGQNRP
jgi:CHAT domain-containing protein